MLKEISNFNFSASIVLLALAAFFYTVPTYKMSIMGEQASKTITKEIDCLAKNIYYEAANEPYEGKLAVAQVTLNRTNTNGYPSSVCDVVYQKTNGTCQFTWTCDTVHRIKERYLWEEAQYIAKKALTSQVTHDKLAEDNALFYHADYVNPGWKYKRLTKIGRHIFYAN
jgi:spore germination cell wall hydrolase CwlJ-like protein